MEPHRASPTYSSCFYTLLNHLFQRATGSQASAMRRNAVFLLQEMGENACSERCPQLALTRREASQGHFSTRAFSQKKKTKRLAGAGCSIELKARWAGITTTSRLR